MQMVSTILAVLIGATFLVMQYARVRLAVEGHREEIQPHN